MAWIPLGGKSRRYRNTQTGEELSRRQYDQRIRGQVSYAKKAEQSKLENLEKALARPARGRRKAATTAEVELRVEGYREYQRQEYEKKIERAAKSLARKARPKKIRPQLLKSGRRAERVNFTSPEELSDLIKQANTVKAPNGKRLITSIGIGLVGVDSRTGNKIGATLINMQSPRVKLSWDDLLELTDDYIKEKGYFIFSHWFMHLHFNYEYAEYRYQQKLKKNLPSNVR